MGEGIIAELAELIQLRRYAASVRYSPDKKALRSGNHLSKLRGRGMDFAEVRNYQAGDEVRHMEWRVTARTGRPHVKIFQEERERPAVIFLDFNASMFFGTRLAFKSVIAARLASILSWTAVKQGDRLGGFIFSDQSHKEFPPRSRDAGVLPFLSALSNYTKQGSPDVSDSSLNQTGKNSGFNLALVRLRRVVKPGSIIVLISDFYALDQESEEHLSRLHAHNDILAYQICDPLELGPPKPALYGISNGKQEILLDTAQADIRNAYESFFDRRMRELAAVMKRNQIQCIQVTGDTDLPQLVKTTYPRRKAYG